MSLSWGAAWGAAALAIAEPAAGALCGALAGAGFASLVARAERRHTIDGLRYHRIAVWGVLGGLALPAGLLASALATHGAHAFWVDRALVAGLVSGACGSVSAVASLALARPGRRAGSRVAAT
jgi:hypothetical protein